MRSTDVVLSFPVLVVILTVVALIGPSMQTIILGIGLFYWPTACRIVRGLSLSLREQDFFLAARALGATQRRVILRHLMPSVLSPLTVTATFAVAQAILLEAALSFLGLGVRPPQLVGQHTQRSAVAHDSESMPWLWLPAGLMIAVTVLRSTSLATVCATRRPTPASLGTPVRVIDVNVLARSASPQHPRRPHRQQQHASAWPIATAPRATKARTPRSCRQPTARAAVATLVGPILRLASGLSARSRGRIAAFPDTQSWIVESEAFQAMRRTIRVPLLLPVERSGDATRIGQATDGDRPVVLTGAHYTQLGDSLAALDAWPHLFLETSRLAHFRALETVVNHVGASRVLFGSGAPARPVQAALNMVLTARIVGRQTRHPVGQRRRLSACPSSRTTCRPQRHST
jgi:hypothetical protein